MRWGFHTFMGFVLVACGGLNPAFAQTSELPASVETNPSAVPSSPECVADLGGQCLLRATYRVLEFVKDLDQRLLLVLGNPSSQSGSDPASLDEDSKEERLVVLDDLLSRVESGEVTADEAELITSDIAQLEGALYNLPELQTLKMELGFPEDTQFAAEDLYELARAHLQLSIGVGPLTAAYLCNRLGVQSVETIELKVLPDMLPVNGPIRLIARDEPQ